MHLNAQRLKEDPAYGELIALIAQKDLSTASADFSLGYEAFGPLLMGILQWLEKALKKKKIKRVSFLPPDGYTLQKGFEAMQSGIPSTYGKPAGGRALTGAAIMKAYIQDASYTPYQRIRYFSEIFLRLFFEDPAPFAGTPEANRLHDLQAGAVAFVVDFNKQAKQIALDASLAFENYQVFAMTPSKDDVKAWVSFRYIPEDGEPLVHAGGSIHYTAHMQAFVHDFERSLWPAGFIKKVFRFDAAVGRLLETYKI